MDGQRLYVLTFCIYITHRDHDAMDSAYGGTICWPIAGA